MATLKPISDDPAAPFGYEEDGVTAKAPYGLKTDNTPRLSNRGARAGQGGGRKARAPRRTSGPRATKNTTDRHRKDLLMGLVDMWVVTPLAGASLAPQVAKRFGPKHAAAFAGDAVIVDQFSEPIADGLIEMSQTRPAMLAWLDTVEEKAPWIGLAMIGIQMGKAFLENHANPNPELVQAGRVMARTKMAQVIESIRADARAMGIDPDGMEPTVDLSAA